VFPSIDAIEEFKTGPRADVIEIETGSDLVKAHRSGEHRVAWKRFAGT
jgi:hypothetical protein